MTRRRIGGRPGGRSFQRLMQRLYYNPDLPTSFSGSLSKLIDKVGVKREKQVEKWLEGERAWTLHRPVRRRYRRRRIISAGINHIWSCDLMDLQLLKRYNNSMKYVLLVVDIFSKKIDTIPLKNKQSTTVTAGFQQILENGKTWGKQGESPHIVNTDSGGEFGTPFRSYLASKGIHHYKALNPDVKSAVAERAIRTIKARLYRYFTHKNTLRYIEVLPRLVQSYNKTKHSSIKLAPNQVTLKTQASVRKNLYGSERVLDSYTHPSQLPQNRKLRKSKQELPLGAYVRISKWKNIFGKKFTPNYSSEIFRVIKIHSPSSTVTNVVGGSGGDIKRTKQRRLLYTLVDQQNQVIAGTFYAEELVKVKI